MAEAEGEAARRPAGRPRLPGRRGEAGAGGGIAATPERRSRGASGEDAGAVGQSARGRAAAPSGAAAAVPPVPGSTGTGAEPGGRGRGRRGLPAVHVLLAHPRLAPWVAAHGRGRVREAVGAELARWREAAAAGAEPPSVDAVAQAAVERLRRMTAPRLVRVINATGVVLHTGLGRAPLAREAVEAVTEVAAGYSNLEFDLASGRRGQRWELVAPLLAETVGAGAALVVNNNAGAVLLVLAALAAGREVVVSRGELVEIGGGFRVPEVMAWSGARLREVGTTNRTHLRDYEEAAGPDTALLLRVHQSNFRMLGFTGSPPLAELAALARRLGVPLVYDLGSGHLEGVGGPSPAAALGEPGVREALAAGAQLVTFSGDKLLGGPQAGLICGDPDLVARCAGHPLHRALRVDKMTLAALWATLELYARGAAAARVPALAMLGRTAPELAEAAERLAAAVRARTGGRCAVEVCPGTSAAGGGALAAQDLPTTLVALAPRAGSAQELADRLRAGRPPLVARVHRDRVLLDPRTLLGDDAEAIPELVEAALG